MIHFTSEDIDFPAIDINKISRWIKCTAAQYGKKTGQINYIFCTDKRILQVNRQYLQHDYYTDIITFDYSAGAFISGDIFISLHTVSFNAGETNTNLADELHRVIIHGILHLCGQGDKTEAEQIEMTRKENDALSLLKFKIF